MSLSSAPQAPDTPRNRSRIFDRHGHCAVQLGLASTLQVPTHHEFMISADRHFGHPPCPRGAPGSWALSTASVWITFPIGHCADRVLLSTRRLLNHDQRGDTQTVPDSPARCARAWIYRTASPHVHLYLNAAFDCTTAVSQQPADVVIGKWSE
jgi:hypothetical protein